MVYAVVVTDMVCMCVCMCVCVVMLNVSETLSDGRVTSMCRCYGVLAAGCVIVLHDYLLVGNY